MDILFFVEKKGNIKLWCFGLVQKKCDINGLCFVSHLDAKKKQYVEDYMLMSLLQKIILAN